jgi:hypothetical protein
MIAGVADTHAAIWFLAGDPRLSAAAKEFFEEGRAGAEEDETNRNEHAKPTTEFVVIPAAGKI